MPCPTHEHPSKELLFSSTSHLRIGSKHTLHDATTFSNSSSSSSSSSPPSLSSVPFSSSFLDKASSFFSSSSFSFFVSEGGGSPVLALVPRGVVVVVVVVVVADISTATTGKSSSSSLLPPDDDDDDDDDDDEDCAFPICFFVYFLCRYDFLRENATTHKKEMNACGFSSSSSARRLMSRRLSSAAARWHPRLHRFSNDDGEKNGALRRMKSRRRTVKAENGKQLREAAARRKEEDERKHVLASSSSCFSSAKREGGKDENKKERKDAVKALVSKVSGFYELGGLDMYRAIDACQRDVFGLTTQKTSLAEIGVYHGRSFLALISLRKNDETCIAIDCFENQADNADESGVGDYSKFRKHVTKACEAMKAGDSNANFEWDGIVDSDTALPSFIKVVKADSTKMTNEADFNEEKNGPVRIFSIDGSHTSEATFRDLTLAADECLHERGVVILDDCFNPDWPGVISGLAKYLDASGRVVPFAIAYNKVYLCDPSIVETYQSRLTPNVVVRKKASLFGRECLVCKQGWLHTFHGNDDPY